MDASRFDDLLRSLTAAGSRRRALTAVLGGVLGLIGLAHPGDAAAGGACRPRCSECERCEKGACKRKHGRKRCKAGKCKPKTTGTACTAGICRGGSCIPICLDGIRNGSESDVDCGGSCPRCGNGRSCASRNDCASALCTGGTCQACTASPECGSDADGACQCLAPTPGASFLCTKGLPTGGGVTDCMLCPPGTICVDSTPGMFVCFEPCGAP